MTYPIHPGPSFRVAQIGESLQTLSLPQNVFIQDRRLTVCSSIAAAVSHHHEESHLIYGPLASILLEQGFPFEYELDEFNTPLTGTTFSRLQYWLCRLRCKFFAPTPSFFISEQHFLEIFTLLPENPEPQIHRWLHRFCPQTANTTFATLWRTYLLHTFNNALTKRCTFRSGI